MVDPRSIVITFLGLTLFMTACSAQDQVDPTGYRGDVLTGTRLEIGDSRSEGRGVVRLSASNVPASGILTVSSAIGGQSCDQFPEGLPCPHAAEAVVVYTASALLNFTERIRLNGSPTATVVQQGEELSETRIAFELPELAPGSHCILIVVLETAKTVVEGQFPDHGIVSLFRIEVGNSITDRCTAELPILESGSGPGMTGTLPSGCGPPNLRNRSPLENADEEAAQAWLVLFDCGESDYAFFTHEGRLLTPTESPHFVVSESGAGEAAVYPLSILEEGWWRAISVTLSETAAPISFYSRPILVAHDR